MVYESDFYTTRRPYSRPSYSSYSVTYEPARLYPGYGKAQTYHHAIPYAGHMRLTAVSAPTFNVRTRPSLIMAEIDRINHRMRPNLAYQPAEDFLNSRSIVSFDDEARSIRGQAASILKRIHTPVPKALRPLPVITTGYEYEELPLPPRITSDMYIQRLLGLRDVQHEVLSRSHYNDPGSRANIGKGHLACVSYAGGKAFSKRRPLASHENNGDYIRNNVKMLSHYERMREAAKSPVVEEKVFPGESRPRFFIRGPRPVNSGYYRPTNDPGKEYAEALASASIATANFNMHTAALEENRRNKQKREEARLAAAAEEREKDAAEADEETSSGDGRKESLPAKQEAQKKLEEEAKKKAEEEAKKRAEEEAKAAEEAKKKAEEEAKKKAEEEAKKKAEEAARRRAEEEAKKKAEEEAKKKAEEEARKKAEEEEARRKAEEEEEAKRKAEEEEAKRKAEEEEAKRKAEEEEAKRKAEEEEAKKKAEEEEAKRKAEEEEMRRKAEEEEEARRKEEEEARIKAEEEEAAKKAEEEAAEAEPIKEDATVDDIWPASDDEKPARKVGNDAPSESKEADPWPAEDEADSKPAEEEPADQGPEPVVEEPTSPETPAPADHPEIEEMPASEEE